MIERHRIVCPVFAMVVAMTGCHAQSSTEVPPSITPGVLSRAATLTTIRAAHTATLLHSGRVLFTGGCTAQSCEVSALSASTEVYDPASGAFTRGPQMSLNRVGGHAATLLRDGTVLIVGGWSLQPTTSAELYDPAQNRLTATRPLGVARADASATLLNDGNVLIAGGYNGSERLASAELYDPATRSFAPTGSMSTARAVHVAVRLMDGRVLIIGGERSRGSVVATAELYDPSTGTFSPAGEMSIVRYKHATVTLSDGRVLVIGGSDARDGFGRYDTAEIWDPHTGTFAPSGRMHNRRYKIPDSVVRLRNGAVLVAGGAPQAELFDPVAQMFELVPGDLGASYAFSSATVLPNGDVLIAGGYDDQIRLTDQVFIFRSR
ncbi:MAG TPA: kelch repeat-containing protein [Gemmatimonadaceae bacterium]|nr:kelch repeat-containing protein [Gemmatimonadaceae bacterium]